VTPDRTLATDYVPFVTHASYGFHWQLHRAPVIAIIYEVALVHSMSTEWVIYRLCVVLDGTQCLIRGFDFVMAPIF
jgi:hypothetical protein